MRNLCVAIAVFVALINNHLLFTEAGVIRHKRSLYREQVSPHLPGGKIPETAFNADRLILNRLQADGIAVPDGIVLEPRYYQVWPYEHRNTKQSYQVQIDHGGHYIAMPLADTTYPVPMPLHYDIKWVPTFKPNALTYVEFPTNRQHGNKGNSFGKHPPAYQATFSYPSSSQPILPPATSTYLTWTITPEMKNMRWPGTNDYASEEVFGDLDSFLTHYGGRVLRHTASSNGKKKIFVPKLILKHKK